jgi:hypothetical protein
MKYKYSLTGIGLIAALTGLLLWGCGDPPPTAPSQGSITIAARTLPDSSLADSMQITLDGVLQGSPPGSYFPNPYTLSNLIIGTHQLIVTTAKTVGSMLFTYSQTQMVPVQPNATLQANFQLQPLEVPAPNFTLKNYDSTMISLNDYAGEVRFLYFFSIT